MINEDTFASRLRQARGVSGLTQVALAALIDVGQRQISQYESGNATPRAVTLERLASVLNTTPEWLTEGVGDLPTLEGSIGKVAVPNLPVLTYQQAFDHVTNNFSCAPTRNAGSFIPAPLEVSQHAFAVKIQGSAMEASDAMGFPDGCIVVFEPGAPVKSGDFALVVDNSTGWCSFKQILNDGTRLVLRSLNREFPEMLVDQRDGHYTLIRAVAYVNFL